MHKIIFGFFLSMLLAPYCLAQDQDQDLVTRARAIHERVVTLDTHIDIPANFATPEVDPGKRGNAQVDLPKMEEGGLNAGFWIVFVPQTERTPQNYAEAKTRAMVKFNAITRMTETMHPDRVALARSAAEVEPIVSGGRIAALIGIENGYVIGTDLSLLRRYYDLGARYITLAHGGHNDIADSLTPRDNLGDDVAEHGGISPFGEKVIEEMNRLGIMVDVSHISKAASLEAMHLSRAPVIASHSSVRALCDHPRNMDDEQLLALKANGGVLQTVAFRRYVKQDPPEKLVAQDSIRRAFGIESRADARALSDADLQEYRAQMGVLSYAWPPATVQDFVSHIDYAVNLIGMDHVGISSDFDGGGVEGWNNAAETFNVTLELVRRGYSEADIAQLWSGNLLRVLRENEHVARDLQSTP